MVEPTEAEVEAQLAETEALAESLEAAVLSGDTTVTHDELTQTKSLVGFLRLQVAGAKRRAAENRAKKRSEAIRALHDEAVRRVPDSGTKLVAALQKVENAAKAFYEMADDYDAMLRDWRVQLNSLDIADSQQEEGIGLNGIGQILIDGKTLVLVDGGQHLNKLFTGGTPYGKLVPIRDVDQGNKDLRDHTYKVLREIAELR